MNYSDAYVLSNFGMMLRREARGEPEEGILAVGHTVIERIARPKWWSKPRHDVISVIFCPMQYTSMTWWKDPQVFIYPDPNDEWLLKCMYIAEQILEGVTTHPAPGASHYYNPETLKVFGQPAPSWTKAPTSKFIRKIGNHDFWFVLD